jgi:hypothetical protein
LTFDSIKSRVGPWYLHIAKLSSPGFRHSEASGVFPKLALAPALQGFQEVPPILFAGKSGLAQATAVPVMANRPRIWNARFSGHGRSLIPRRQRRQPKKDALAASPAPLPQPQETHD